MKKTLLNIIYSCVYQVLIMIVPVIVTPYISRVLGPSNIGIYSYYYSVAGYFSIFIMLGLANYGVRAIAEKRHDKKELSKTFCNIYAMQLFCGLAVFAIYFVYCIGLSRNIKATSIMSLYVISNIFDITWFFNGMEEFKQKVKINSIVKIISVICIFVFVRNGDDIYKYIAIMALGYVVPQIVLWVKLIEYITYVKPCWKEIKTHIRPNLILFISVVAVSIFKIMDKIMLGLMSTKTEVGYYEAAERIILVPAGLISAVGSVMLAKMSGMQKDALEQKDKIINVSVILAILLTSILSFGIMAVSREFVPVFYGNGYDVCVMLYLILLPSCVFLCFANVIRTQYLLPAKMDSAYITSAILGAIVNVVINAITIPSMGCVGVAMGTLFAELVVCVFQSYSVRKYISIKKYVIDVIPFVIAGLIMFGIVYSITLSSIKNNILAICVKIFIGAVVYIAVLVPQMLLLRKRYVWIKDMVRRKS